MFVFAVTVLFIPLNDCSINGNKTSGHSSSPPDKPNGKCWKEFDIHISTIKRRQPPMLDEGLLSEFRTVPVSWAYGVVVSMFDFDRSDRGSNPGRGGKIS